MPCYNSSQLSVMQLSNPPPLRGISSLNSRLLNSSQRRIQLPSRPEKKDQNNKMEGEDSKQQQAEYQAGKEVIITVYEEPLPRPNARPSTEHWRPRPPSLGYDRRGLLLAYSQELRQFQSQNDKKIPRPDWKKWKAAFTFTDLSMRNGLRRKFRLWIRRVLGSVRRRESIIPEDESSRSCCDDRSWKRVLSRISWVCQCGCGV